MPEIGVRELKARASEILREVRDRRTRYVVTHRGRPVGLLVPMPQPRAEEPSDAKAWEELARLGEEISEGWKSPIASDEILSEMRR